MPHRHRLFVAAVIAVVAVAAGCSPDGGDGDGGPGPTTPVTGSAPSVPSATTAPAEPRAVVVLQGPGEVAGLDAAASAALVEAVATESEARGFTTTVGRVGPSPAGDLLLDAIDDDADAVVLVGIAPDDLGETLTEALAARVAVFGVGTEGATGVAATFEPADGADPAVAATDIVDTLDAYFTGTIPDPAVPVG